MTDGSGSFPIFTMIQTAASGGACPTAAPRGGSLNYDTRVQNFTLDINPDIGAISNFHVAQTVKFTKGGVPFNGINPSPANVLGNSFDPEGFVVHPATGHLFVSDEYGPSLY